MPESSPPERHLAGGRSVAGEISKRGLQAARGWISSYLAGHGAEVQRRAEENTTVFLNDLAQRVSALEEELRAQGGEFILPQHLSEPDFHATLHTALITSARTESQEKHLLLSRIVAERLNAEAESLTALASAQAVDVISRLTLGQLNFLGVGAVVYGIRPSFVIEGAARIQSVRDMPRRFEEVMAMYREVGSDYSRWLQSTLEEHGDAWTRVANSDLTHLVSAACLILETHDSSDLPTVLGRVTDNILYPRLSLSLEIPRLLRLGWDFALRRVTLTPVGYLIGVGVHDAKVGGHTPLDLNKSPFAALAHPKLSSFEEEMRVRQILDDELHRRGL